MDPLDAQAAENQPRYGPYREYVWGLDYIDELIAYYENEWGGQSAIITDAN